MSSPVWYGFDKCGFGDEEGWRDEVSGSGKVSNGGWSFMNPFFWGFAPSRAWLFTLMYRGHV
ncbi:hypothetical protein RB213_003459 [Colletotrichum asianum]